MRGNENPKLVSIARYKDWERYRPHVALTSEITDSHDPNLKQKQDAGTTAYVHP